MVTSCGRVPLTMALGRVLLFGSGEVSPTAQPIYDDLLRRIARPVRIAVLETPAGFQLNSAAVAEEVAAYFHAHLPNHTPLATVVPARRRGTPLSPDHDAILGPLLAADVVFLGPGSPTYAIRQLQGSLAWQVVSGLLRTGRDLVLASAATVAASSWALPVYEIYKAGEDPHWVRGLDLWGMIGLSVVFVPHWNNHEGGAKHDTSRCFMGRSRFRELLALLPPGEVVVGIDEHTALSVEAAAGRCVVMGVGAVTMLLEGAERSFPSGTTFPLSLLGEVCQAVPQEGIPARVQALIEAAQQDRRAERAPSEAVLALLADRQAARDRQDWAAADRLRMRLAAEGWSIQDTREGPRLTPLG